MFKKLKDLLASPTTKSVYADITKRLLIELHNKSKEIAPYEQAKLSDLKTYAEVKAKDNTFKKELFFYLVEESAKGPHSPKYLVMTNLVRQKIEFTEEELIGLFTAYHEYAKEKIRFVDWPLAHTFTHLEKHVKKHGLSDNMRNFISDMAAWDEIKTPHDYWAKPMKKLESRIIKIIHGDGVPPYQMSEEDDFGIFVNKQLSAVKDATLKSALYQMLHHTQKANAGKPSKKFQTKAKEIVDSIGIQKYKNHVLKWLEAIIPMQKTQRSISHSNNYTYEYYTFLEEGNATVAKGLVWSLAQFHDTKTLNLLAQLAERAFKKIPGVGPASGAVGNACLYVLGNTKGLLGISHLSQLGTVIRQNNTKKLIQKYLNAAAERLNIKPEEIQELAVADYGLENGRKILEFDDYALEFELLGIGKASQRWIKPDGKIQKTVPAFVKNTTKHKNKYNKAKEEFKNIKKQLTAQRNRIDRLYVADRELDYDKFEQYYVKHGLIGFLANKLIWCFDNGKDKVSVIRQGDIWQDASGNEVKANTNTKVSLWHPVHEETEQVLVWRNRLETLQIRQPMKQAYREVYILTDAEINTRMYSNRMAAHLLKQLQFSALANGRGWKYSLLGVYDDGRDCEIAILPLKAYGITAEYWINELYAEGEHTDSGILNYVSTDQVKFLNEQQQTVELVDIPKIVFSEVMRDVDLFVGVASVGNDPNWRDNGGLTQFRDYWESYSFGDLTEVAKTRKQVLEKLVPRLKIRDIARIDGKFLRVKGKLREYKIHIGSTNILMEPNDQYLCIVPDRGGAKATDKLFLPFEGDRGLSLVLSKAFLLAEDDKITDTTIVSQIKP